MNLEHELKRALERKAPPPDFAERVLRRATQPPVNATTRHPWRAIAAAVLMTAVLGGWAAREASQQREGERAREEVLTALRITTEKLRTAQDHVHHIGSESN
jgi:hypothetical protein